jgi:glycosyltransferase involved in cell wall biosynthesis
MPGTGLPERASAYIFLISRTDVSPGSIPVSVIVLTHNEAVNVVSCLETLSAFNEILVVDSGSTDGTLDILRNRFPGIRVLHHTFQDFGQQRNWALEHGDVRNEWILFFDADERCTVECASAVLAAIAEPGGHVGFFLCYRNMFLGRWIKRCTMYPTWQLRLLKVGQVRYRREGHGQREVMEGTAGYINEPYDHYGFSKGIKDWVARHNEYSSNETQLIKSLAESPLGFVGVFSKDPVRRRRALKRLAARAPLRPLVRFVYLFLIRRGFLDGRPGLIFCLLRAAHELHIVAKLAEASDATLTAAAGASQSKPMRSSKVAVAKSSS